MRLPLASPTRRGVAALLNIVAGILPLGIPEALASSPEPELPFLKHPAATHIISIILAVLQMLFVYYMQGSPGYVFTGLRVETLDGSRPELRHILVRWAPFTALFLLYSVPRPASGDFVKSVLLALISSILFLLLAVSGIVLLIDRKYSLLDIVSKTRVVKVYSINPRDDQV